MGRGGPGVSGRRPGSPWAGRVTCRTLYGRRHADSGDVTGADNATAVRGVYSGRLRNAHQVEALTANLIAINRRYKAHAGLRVTDV